MAELDPTSRDMIIRTVLGEAANQGPTGQAAVAHVIRNRMATGRWGKTGTEVVLAPKQFEPWDSSAGRLMSYSPEDRRYQSAAQIVDQVFGGQSQDPTKGSTHFYAPVAQAQLGRNAPSWSRGQQGIKIGGHTFFAPEGRSTGKQHMGWASAQDFWNNPMGGGMGSAAGQATPSSASIPSAQSVPGSVAPGGNSSVPAPPQMGSSQGMPQMPRSGGNGQNTPFLGRMLFGDGGLQGALGPQGMIPTPGAGNGMLGNLLGSITGGAGGGGAAASAAPSLLSAAGPAAGAAGAGAGAASGLGAMLSSLFALI